MNDDWRVEADLRGADDARALVEALGSPDLEHQLDAAFHDRVVVSREGEVVFLYAGTREQAEGSRQLLLGLSEKRGWGADVGLKRWHPTAEDWEDPDKPVPDGVAAERAEHAELIATERRETEERGRPEFDVRADLPSHHDAVRFAEQLRGEGLPVAHRWRYLLIGVSDEDSAKALAERLQSEAPPGAKVTVEGTWQAAYKERPPNPYAVFGGLGG